MIKRNTDWTQIHPRGERNTKWRQILLSRKRNINWTLLHANRNKKIYWIEMNAGKDRNTKWHKYMQAKIEISSEHKYTQAKIEIPRQIQSWVSVGVDFLVELCYTWIIGTPTASPRLCQSRSCTSSSLDGERNTFHNYILRTDWTYSPSVESNSFYNIILYPDCMYSTSEGRVDFSYNYILFQTWHRVAH